MMVPRTYIRNLIQSLNLSIPNFQKLRTSFTPAGARLSDVMADLLLQHYTVDEKTPERVVPMIRSAVLREEGELKLLVSPTTGQKLVEISRLGTHRFFDGLNERWIMALDRYGNKTDELAWEEQGKHDQWDIRVRTLNGNRKWLAMYPTYSQEGDKPLLRGVTIKDENLHVFNFRPGLDFFDAGIITFGQIGPPPSIFSITPAIHKLIQAASGSYYREGSEGIGNSVMRVLALLARDQGNPLTYLGVPDHRKFYSDPATYLSQPHNQTHSFARDQVYHTIDARDFLDPLPITQELA